MSNDNVPETGPANEHAIQSEAADNVVSLPLEEETAHSHPIAQFVHDHPLITIAGGLAIGAAAAALIPRKNREKVTRTASHWKGAAGAAAMALIQQALEKAEETSDIVKQRAGNVGTHLEAMGEKTSAKAGQAGERIVETASQIRKLIQR